jgi:GATA-binding protein 4
MIGQMEHYHPHQTEREKTEDEFEKRTCTACGTSNTSLWRRFQGQIVCNACGLYLKANGQKRPDWLQQRKIGKHRKLGDAENNEMIFHWQTNDTKQVSCSNCQTTTSSLWRKNEQNMHVCNSCWLWKKMHGCDRPIEMKTNVIKRRKRLSATIPKNELNFIQNTPPVNNVADQETRRLLHHAYPREGRQSQLEQGGTSPMQPPISQEIPLHRPIVRRPQSNSHVYSHRPQRSFDLKSDGYNSQTNFSQGYDTTSVYSSKSAYSHPQAQMMTSPTRNFVQNRPYHNQTSILTAPGSRHTYSASCPGTKMPYYTGYQSLNRTSDTTSSNGYEKRFYISTDQQSVGMQEWPSVDEQICEQKHEPILSPESEKYPSLPLYYKPQPVPITPLASPDRLELPWEKTRGAMSVLNLLN